MYRAVIPGMPGSSAVTSDAANPAAGAPAGPGAAGAPRVTKADASLANLQNRMQLVYGNVQELHDLARQLRDGVGEQRALGWEHLLVRYALAHKLVSQLSDDMDRALSDGLDNFVAVPVAATADPAVLPELLRTRDETAVEKALDEQRRAFAAAAQNDPSLRDAEATATRVRAFNSFVEDAVDKLQDMREALANRVPDDSPVQQQAPSASAILAALSSGAGLRVE